MKSNDFNKSSRTEYYRRILGEAVSGDSPAESRMRGDLHVRSFVLSSLNYLLNIEFARYKISTNWDHKADWANGKGGVSRSAIDYKKTFPELQPSLSIQDTNNYLYHNH
ncbi:unnamed protein product [Lathyrus sativus]|nr:unnamed protein product [Lathyrus sativus]